MNAYEWKQEQRRARLESRAARLSVQSDATFSNARRALDGIEPGQPILVGHHSEKRHRRALQRHDDRMRKGFALMDAAADAARKAASAGTGGISSDDPDAIAKLADKRSDLERLRDDMKAANAYWRKHGTLDGAPIAEATRKKADSNIAFQRHWYPTRAPVPFESFTLTNLGARIRDAAKRAEQIVAVQAMERTEETVNGCTIVVDPDDNRVLLTFPARLDRDAYKAVRSYGWLWSPSRNAFVRKIGGAIHSARLLAEQYGKAE